MKFREYDSDGEKVAFGCAYLGCSLIMWGGGLAILVFIVVTVARMMGVAI
jgi:hypothetical protein